MCRIEASLPGSTVAVARFMRVHPRDAAGSASVPIYGTSEQGVGHQDVGWSRSGQIRPQYSTLACRIVSETLRRAVGTLDALARADADLSIREIADEVEVSKSAVQRLLSSLVETGL